jgi:CRISPR-associated endoribonuclease Cas6
VLTRIIITLTVQGEAVPSVHWGSLLHGVLMQKLNPDYVDFLHGSGLKPLSQYVLPLNQAEGGKGLKWTVNLMGEDAVQEVLPVLQSIKEYYLEHKKTYLKVEEINVDKKVSEEEFCFKYLADSEYLRYPPVKFLTPCSHKSGGQYSLFPSTELILKSLVQKWNSYASLHALQDEKALEQMIFFTRIQSYNLRSTKYYLESVRIPSYIGKLTLAVQGPDPLVRLINMLLYFAEYSGIGIKTSLGMGACVISRP